MIWIRKIRRLAPCAAPLVTSVALAAWAGTAIAQEGLDLQPAKPLEAAIKPVTFTRLALKLTTGQSIGRMKWGVLCVPVNQIAYDPESFKGLEVGLTRTFYEEVSKAGYKGFRDPNSLFPDQDVTGATELQVGASLETVVADVCDVYGKPPNLRAGKGKLTFGFEWQIYSTAEKRVLASIHTTGEGSLTASTANATSIMAERAVIVNVRQLVASQEFKKAVMSPSKSPLPTVTVHGSNLAALTYQNRNNGPSTVADGVGGVVAIFNSDGMGSGFLIGAEGLLLTNRHVVGGDKFVKVRWADGVETVGEVLRSDTKRDVALVKTDARGRQPLRLQTMMPQPGEDVYAIGTPLAERYQSTVTKGVVSANRTVDGLSYIQSDVAINHGNSGGPLLDKSGAVLGITVLSLQPVENVQVGINLFIPLRDALDFLALKPQG